MKISAGTVLTTKDVDITPELTVLLAVDGLLVVQATHLSSIDLLDIIQVGHSHDPSAGLNFWASSDYNW